VLDGACALLSSSTFTVMTVARSRRAAVPIGG
jgi:hypothetical protein